MLQKAYYKYKMNADLSLLYGDGVGVRARVQQGYCRNADSSRIICNKSTRVPSGPIVCNMRIILRGACHGRKLKSYSSTTRLPSFQPIPTPLPTGFCFAELHEACCKDINGSQSPTNFNLYAGPTSCFFA
jgi:hypothetical protein